jgi:2-polyprenyl-3-methyl-5-hydroxy-6-metoxy-1,4-benzoquinol methylase
VHDTLRHLHGRSRSTGTTLDRFRLNELVSQIAFAGRRRRVYRRIVALSGVRPGDSVLDVGSSSGYLARKLAAVAGRPATSPAWTPRKRRSRTPGGARFLP